MDERTRNLLSCLLDTASFDQLIGGLVEITALKAEKAPLKREQKQWIKASDRLEKLRVWCAEFGPGSGCL